ncbi:DUF3566 domain-containing protein [Streptomyces fuscichromogenes]|uniref:DUF3566 domain-containing protein n=1 Tax=Streptomyces fuscichromogenes TaxID=1324013 RepID=A0A917XDK0_9ACTN|nr:DUF3566 domain-containing protein [Streptomyces fuscichromogenes]GGN10009.1 hypothetical protein GCM10011578_035570 [Streptomyces fuscichromogenes]
MSRTKHSRTRSTARKRTPRIASRIVAAPTAPTPARPDPKPTQPAPTRDHALPHAPPHRPTHIRISETNPWSVTVMSFFFLAGLGVCVLGAALVTSVILDIVAPGEWPTPWETLVIATGVVTLEIVLGTVLACLCSFMYNYTARFSGGLEVALTDDLSDPTPAAQALQLMTRLHAGARRRLHAFLPVNSPAGERPYRRRPDDTPRSAVEADHRPEGS